MDQGKEMTIPEVLDMTIKELNAVSVPMALYATIGVPVARAIENINICLKTIVQNAPKQEETTKDDIQIGDIKFIEAKPEE